MKKNVFTTTYNGQTIKAQMSYYYKTGGTSITKPFIVVEGFDPWILQELLQEEIPIEHVHIGFTRHSGFYKSNWQGSTLNDEYDLFYIDWDNTLIDIRANAQLLTQIIEEINTLKANSGCTEPNIIMGQSMGGLIARHALRTMETEAKVHETSTFISHDSPHTGANVPLGALYFIQQILSLAHGNSNIVSCLQEDF